MRIKIRKQQRREYSILTNNFGQQKMAKKSFMQITEQYDLTRDLKSSSSFLDAINQK